MGLVHEALALEGAVMDFYATALIEVAIDLIFWVRSRLSRKRPAMGRPSVPLVPPPGARNT